jgi:hypothetical protein
MPYHVGEKGSYGCSGYPALKDDGTVMGCHTTAEEAANQIYAINQSEGNVDEKDMITNDGGMGIKNPQAWPGTEIKDPKVKKDLPDAYRPASSAGVPAGQNCANCSFYDATKVLDGKAYCTKWDDYVLPNYYCKAWAPKEVAKADPCWDGYAQRGMKPGRGGSMVPNCVPVSKAEAELTEGDFVMARTTEGMIVGQVEHIMLEGGTYGEPGNPYAVESTPENPAVAIRILEEDDGVYYYTPYSIGALMSNVERINMPNISMEDYEEDNDMEMMSKADTYTPTSGMKAAARRALKWKEDGKATGAGTPVGWGRATDIVAGRAMSLSTVKRMFSFFSRHEVDKKGKDFYNTSNPSNGRIMWDAWGGDAGFSWSRGIVNRMKDKALFNNFGKDFTRSTGMTDLFAKAKSISVGDHVTFAVPKPPAAPQRAHGEVDRIERSGTVTVGNEKFEATADNPVAVITVYAVKEDGGYMKTDRKVAKPFSALSVADSDLKEAFSADTDIEKLSVKRLQELADKYNEGKEGNKRITVGALRQVYNRGIGAYRTNPGSVRPNVSSAEQWAMGRVNAFMAGLRGNFPRTAFDLDLFPKGHPRYSEKKPGAKKSDFGSFGRDVGKSTGFKSIFDNF